MADSTVRMDISELPEFTHSTTPVAAECTGPHRLTLTRHLEDDLPGGGADLSHRFTLDGALISSLVVAP
ncbi:hypothetical protein ACWERF_19235 [Streptomyces griseoluteus]